MIDRCGPLRAAKLHELVYYGQAWSLGLRDVTLFSAPIHAWARGPVVFELLEQHRNRYTVKRVTSGSAEALSGDDVEFLDAMLTGYRKLGSRKLTELTRSEAPWRLARAAVASTDDPSAEITVEHMREYYAQAVPPFALPTAAPAASDETPESFATRAGRAAKTAVTSYGVHAAVLVGVAATYALTRRA